MNFEIVRRHLREILAVLFMGGLVVVGLHMKAPDHDAALTAAMADLVAHGTLSGTIRIETLMPSDTLGFHTPNVPVIRLPIGIAGPFRVALGKDVPPIFAADLSLALEGGETTTDAPGADVVTDGHDATYIRPRNLPVKSLNGQWMRMTSQEFAEVTGGTTVVADAASPPRDPDLGSLKALIASGIVQVDLLLAPEDVAGHATRHYRVVPVAEKFGAFIDAVNMQFLGRDLTNADREAMAKKMAGFTLVAEAWIDKDAPVLRRFGFDLRPIAGNDAAPIRVVIDFGPADGPVEDSIPEDSTDLMETFLKQSGTAVAPS
jgi:hypothetical protein